MLFRSGHLDERNKCFGSDNLSKIAANWRDLAAQYFINTVKQQYFIFYQPSTEVDLGLLQHPRWSAL